MSHSGYNILQYALSSTSGPSYKLTSIDVTNHSKPLGLK